MSDLLGEFDLESPLEVKLLRIEIFRGIEDPHLVGIERQWMPVLRARSALAALEIKQRQIADDGARFQALQDALQDCGAPDGHWDWRQKVLPVAQSVAHASFVVTCAGHIEAAMLCDLTRRARIAAQQDELINYVDYLAVAPWNRPQVQSPRKLRGLGQLLIATAVSLSLDEGFKGRLGLHSLPQSETFYAECGMTNLGPDKGYSNLKYFEFTDEQAEAFLTDPGTN